MRKEAAWLLAELNGLVQAGVLDAEAAARLQRHYAGGRSARLGWGMVLLAIGGSALVGLGIVLIFAHNWDNWTPNVRAGVSLLPLIAGQAVAAYALRNGARVWREGAALFTAIAVGASIALVAQTYHFGGDLPRFLLIWLLLTAPLVYLFDATAVAVGGWALALGWAFASWNEGWWSQRDGLQDALRVPVFLALFALYVPHLVRHILVDRATARVAWMLRTAIVVFVLGLGFSHPRDDNGETLLIAYAALSAVFMLGGRRYFADVHGVWGNPALTAGFVGVFAIALSLTLRDVLADFDGSFSGFMALPAAFGALAVWIAWQDVRDGRRLVEPLVAALPVLAFVLPLTGGSAPAVIAAHVYVLLLAGSCIRDGLRAADLALANFGVALVAALVLLRFFDSDFSYVVRGIGFIVTGIGAFAAIFALRRRLPEAPA